MCTSLWTRVRVDVARVPVSLGRWSAAWRRQGGPPEAGPLHSPGFWHWAAEAGRSLLSEGFSFFCSQVGLPFLVCVLLLGQLMRRRLFARLVLHKGSDLCTSGAPSPFPSLTPFHLAARLLVLFWTFALSSSRMISGWFLAHQAAGFRLVLASMGHVVPVNRGHSPTPERKRRMTVTGKG